MKYHVYHKHNTLSLFLTGIISFLILFNAECAPARSKFLTHAWNRYANELKKFAWKLHTINMGFAFKEQRLVYLNVHGEPRWVNPEFISDLIKKRRQYFDVTDLPVPPTRRNSLLANVWRRIYHPIPNSARYQSFANNLTLIISKNKIKGFVESLCRYTNRMAVNELGRESQVWLHTKVIQPIIELYDSVTVQDLPLDFEPEGFPQYFKQDSLIVRLDGSDPVLGNEIVIVGAHYDSINTGDGDDEDGRRCLTPECLTKRAPGANDNASGVSVVVEALRVLTKIAFKRTIEFHFYAGGEYGLRGSLATAAMYAYEGKQVIGVVTFDMVGIGTGPISIFTKDTHPQLNQLLRLLIDTYLKDVGWVDKEDIKDTNKLSDYAAWSSYTFPAAFPTVSNSSSHLHSDKDVVEALNFDQIVVFAKLAVVYIVELGEALGPRPKLGRFYDSNVTLVVNDSVTTTTTTITSAIETQSTTTETKVDNSSTSSEEVWVVVPEVE